MCLLRFEMSSCWIKLRSVTSWGCLVSATGHEDISDVEVILFIALLYARSRVLVKDTCISFNIWKCGKVMYWIYSWNAYNSNIVIKPTDATLFFFVCGTYVGYSPHSETCGFRKNLREKAKYFILILQHFLGGGGSKNCKKWLLASSFLSIPLSAWDNSAPTGRIFMKPDIRTFFETL